MRGSNHVGMRQFNERTVLQAIRHHGAIPKADLARLTQLSTQTVAIIVGRLLDDGLLLKQDRVRGKIGQPSVPLSLNPQGAFSVGIQVGRRNLELLLADFTGQPVVMNGASNLLLEAFGEAGRHARSAVGVAVLPRNAPVEVEVIVEVAD